MANVIEILDSLVLQRQAVAIPSLHGQLSIQNINGTLYQVDEAGTTTAIIGGGGGSGTVTSVAATVGGLLEVAGTPTVAPTVGIAAMAANTVIGNFTGGSAVPTAGKVTLAAMATQADQTVLGNGSGGSAVPVALALTTGNGIVATSTALQSTLKIGVAGGQTIYGGTLTTQSLTIQPNIADATTGHVLVGSSTKFDLDVGNVAMTIGSVTRDTKTIIQASKSTNGAVLVAVENANAGASAYAGFVATTGDSVFANPFVSYYITGVGAGTANQAFLDMAATGGLVVQNNTNSTVAFKLGGALTTYLTISNGADITAADRIAPASDGIYDLGKSGKNWGQIFCNVIAHSGSNGTVTLAGSGPGSGVFLDSSTTGLISISHQSTNGRFMSDATGIAFFFNAGAPAGVAQQVSGANLTNNVTSGGTNDTIANFTDLTIYANDSAAIRNDIYQLSRKLKQVNDGLRAYGLFT